MAVACLKDIYKWLVATCQLRDLIQKDHLRVGDWFAGDQRWTNLWKAASRNCQTIPEHDILQTLAHGGASPLLLTTKCLVTEETSYWVLGDECIPILTTKHSMKHWGCHGCSVWFNIVLLNNVGPPWRCLDGSMHFSKQQNVNFQSSVHFVTDL